jgi:hypothetical protein
MIEIKAITELKKWINESADSARITGIAGSRAIVDGKPSVILAEETGETEGGKQKFKLELLVHSKPRTELGDVTSDIVLDQDDLIKIKKMNEKGLRGYKSQIESE